MAKKTTTKQKKTNPAPKTSKVSEQTWYERLQSEVNLDQSLFSLVLGALIVIVLAVLVFKFFSSNSSQIGTSQQTVSPQSSPTADVSKDNLPGPYTVKDGDTLFLVAQNYYGNGYLYQQIADANNITDVNNISTGQVLTIPKIDTSAQNVSSPSAQPSVMEDLSQNPDAGRGGAADQTIWGEAISGTTYTVQAGDWLSKIAGRAYGDIYSFDKIAKANNISDPNNIEPGTVLQIPR